MDTTSMINKFSSSEARAFILGLPDLDASLNDEKFLFNTLSNAYEALNMDEIFGQSDDDELFLRCEKIAGALRSVHSLRTRDIAYLCHARDVEAALIHYRSVAGNLYWVLDDIAVQWEKNLHTLVEIKKVLLKYPEWRNPDGSTPQIHVDSIHVNTGSVISTEENINILLKAGLVDKNYLTSFVRDITHRDYFMDDSFAFERLARIREIAERNPDWTVDWRSDWFDPNEGDIIARFIEEGYWTTDTLQKMINDVAMFHPTNLESVRDLLAAHREWDVKIPVKDPDYAFELGLDFVCMKQPLSQIVTLANRMSSKL